MTKVRCKPKIFLGGTQIFKLYSGILLLLFSRYMVSNSFVTRWTLAHQAPLSMGFSEQEYWSGLPFTSPGDLSNPWIKPASPVLQVDFLPLSHQGTHI